MNESENQSSSNAVAYWIIALVFLCIVSGFGYDYYKKNLTTEAKISKDLDRRFIQILVDKEVKEGIPHDSLDRYQWRYVNIEDCTLIFRDVWLDSLEFPDDIDLRRSLLKRKSLEYFNAGLWKAR